MAAFTFVSITVKRFLAQVFPASFPATITHTSGDTTNLEIAIGEHLYISHSLTADLDLRSKTVHFSPSMFAPINNVVGVWWEFIIPSNAANGDIVTGTLLTLNNSAKNYSVDLTLVSVGATTSFTINMDTYATMDTNGFVLNQSYSNQDRFLKNSELNPSKLDNGNYGDYFHSDNVAQANGIYYFALEALDQFNQSLIPYIELPEGSINVKGKFYDQDFNGAANGINTPVFEVFNEAGNITFDNFSKLENVKIKFKAKFVAAPITNSGVVYLIRTNSSNDQIDFIQNYETGEARILTDAGSAVINEGIKNPATTWTGVGLTVYQISFHIDKAHLNTAGLYRIIVICYDTTAGKVCSFISDEYAVNEIPSCSDIETDFGIKDTVGNSGTDITTSVQDRMIVYDKGNYSDTQVYINEVIAKTDPSLIITPGQVQLEIYTEDTLLPGGSIFKQVYETQTINFLNWVWDAANLRFYAYYGAPANLVWGFINQNEMFFSSDGLTMTDWNAVLYHFRARYEANIPNIADYLNGIQQPFPTSNQNWADRVLFVSLTITMNYSFTKDGTPYAYCDKRQFLFRLTIIDYENNTGFFKLQEPQLFDTNGAPVIDICAINEMRMEATKSGALPVTGRQIIFIDRQNYGIGNLEEEDAFTPDSDFPILTSNKIDPVAPFWNVLGEEEIFIDQLNQAGVYRGSLMYKSIP